MALLHSIERIPLFMRDWNLKVLVTAVVMLKVYYLACKHSMEARELGHTSSTCCRHNFEYESGAQSIEISSGNKKLKYPPFGDAMLPIVPLALWFLLHGCW